MNKLLTIFATIFIFSSSSAYADGEGGHNESSLMEQTEFDSDGFEIISNGPSEESLEQINSKYLNGVKQIFAKKCLSCHGVNNDLPWYYNIPGVKQTMDNDMEEAKKHMDMSHDFPFGGHGSPVDDLNALFKTIKKDEMPPLKYKIIHWDSGLTENEIFEVNKWIKDSKLILRQEEN